MMFLGLGQAFMAMAAAMNFPLAEAPVITAPSVNAAATATIQVWDLDVINPLPAEYQSTMPTFTTTTSLLAVDGDFDEPTMATVTMNKANETAFVHVSAPSPFSFSTTTTLPLTKNEMTIPIIALNATAALVNATAAPTMEADDIWNNYFDSITNWWMSFFDQLHDEITIVSANSTMAGYDNFLVFWPAAKELNVNDFVVDFNFSLWSAYYTNVTETTMDAAFSIFDSSFGLVDDSFKKASAWSSHSVDSLWNSTLQLCQDAVNATYSPADSTVKSVYAWASHVANSARNATQKLFDQVPVWTHQTKDSAPKSSTTLHQTLPLVQCRMAMEEAQKENAMLEKIVQEFQQELWDAHSEMDRLKQENESLMSVKMLCIKLLCVFGLGFAMGRFNNWMNNRGRSGRVQKTLSALRALAFCQRSQLQKVVRRGEVSEAYFRVQACEISNRDEYLPGPFDDLWNLLWALVQCIWYPFDVFFNTIDLILNWCLEWLIRGSCEFWAWVNGFGICNGNV